MRGLFLCCAIGCLAFATAAPAEEKLEGIFSNDPFSNNQLVHAACGGSDGSKKCKVLVETGNADDSAGQTCDVTLPYAGRADFKVVLANAGNSRAVFAVRDEATTLKLIVVNRKDCQVKEASLEVPQQLTREFNGPLNVVIVPHENDYDVIYENNKLCQDNVCKATLDYEGKIVKEPASFPLKHLPFAFRKIKAVNKGYLVSEIVGDQASKVYFVDKDGKVETLYSGKESALGISTEENKVSFCAHEKQKLQCKQYDADGKTKKLEIDMETGKGRTTFLDVLNLEKGLLTASIGQDGTETVSFVAHFDEQGKQGKYASVDFKCSSDKVVLPKLYKNSNGEYCVASLCFEPLDSSDKSANYTRTNKCFSKTELF